MNCQVSFDEPTHIYTNTKTSEKYESVTTIIGKYKNKFETERIAKEYVVNHPELGFKNWKEVVALWDDIRDTALVKGNIYHNTQELQSLLAESNLNADYNDHVKDLKTLPDGVYPELRIYNHKYKKAGTVDKVIIETIDNIRWVDIKDYKTNKHPLGYQGFKGQTMLGPLSYLQDASYSHYSLQMCIYGYFLEQFGYKVRSLELIHKRYLNEESIPESEFIPFESREDQLRKFLVPKHVPVKYLPLRIKSLLEYDKHLIAA